MAEEPSATRENYVPIVVPGLSTGSSSVQVRLPLRHRRARLVTLHQVQPQYEVTAQAFRHRETN